MKKYLRLPYLPIILAPIILLSPVLFTGRAMFWGTPSLQFIPWWDYALDTLLSGHLPLWNPLVGMGAPLIANYQSALFYPPNWVYLILGLIGGTPLMAWGMALLVTLHLMWSGLGMAALTRKLGLGRLAQTVAGLAFGLSGYLVSRAGFLSINSAVAWLPWILLFSFDILKVKTIKILKAESFRTLAKLGLVIGLQLLAGHAQTTWYTLVLAGTWVIFWAWVQSDAAESLSRLMDVVRGMVRYAGAGLIGIGLAAVQLFPTAEYLLQSQRSAAVDYEIAMVYSFWPWRFLTLIAPDMFGNPVHGNFWGYATYWEDAVYIGLLPLLLAITALYSLRKRRSQKTFTRRYTKKSRRHTEKKLKKENSVNLRATAEEFSEISSRLTFYLLLITLISFTLALGDNTPIFPWLYRHVPTFDMFQAPTRLTIWAIFALSLLAAIGIEHWRRPQKRALYWTRLGTAGAFAISMGAGLAWYFMGDVKMTFIRASALAGLWALGTGALALTAPQRDEDNVRMWWQWAVAVWLMADLLVAGWGLNPGIERDFYHPGSETFEGRVYLPAQDEQDLKFERFLSFEDFSSTANWDEMRVTLLPNLNMLDNVPMVNNFDPFVPGRYHHWMKTLEEVEVAPWVEMLNLMAVTDIEHISSTEDLGVTLTPWGDGVRARWMGCAYYAGDGKGALGVIAGGVDLSNWIVLEGQRLTIPTDCSAGVGEAVQGGRISPNEVSIHVEANQPGWVLWSEVWYPGWRAWVDGQPVDVERGDYLFQAIPVPAGEHEVVVAYRPVWFYVGGAVSVLSLGAVIFFLRKFKSLRLI